LKVLAVHRDNRTDPGAGGAERTAPSLALDCDRAAPRRARDHVFDLLQKVPDAPQFSEDDLFDVLLCTSELVNAALLGGCGSMTLDVDINPAGLRITLQDDTPGTVPALESARAQAHCLHVVANIADRWDSELTSTVRVTRAEFDVPRARRAQVPPRG
jgi:hypothetical protein